MATLEADALRGNERADGAEKKIRVSSGSTEKKFVKKADMSAKVSYTVLLYRGSGEGAEGSW